LALTPRASRLVWIWWGGLHVLLAAATVLVGWPCLPKVAALAVIAGHAAVRRPRPTLPSIIVAEDATWGVPTLSSGRTPLGPRTVMCTHWVALDLGSGAPRRHLVLFVDQLDAEQWARLRALLGRARCDAAHVLAGPGEPI
jgi:hypothetical protein